MANAQDDHPTLRIDFIDDQVRAVRMRADGGRDFNSKTCGVRVFGEEGECCGQAFVVSVGLCLAEQFEALEVDSHQIIRRRIRQLKCWHGQAFRPTWSSARARMSAIVSVLIPLSRASSTRRCSAAILSARS